MSDEPVIRFYNSHPMSEWQILRTLEKRGKPLSGLTPEDLFYFDQDHYGGVQAVELLAERNRERLPPGARTRWLLQRQPRGFVPRLGSDSARATSDVSLTS